MKERSRDAQPLLARLTEEAPEPQGWCCCGLQWRGQDGEVRRDPEMMCALSGDLPCWNRTAHSEPKNTGIIIAQPRPGAFLWLFSCYLVPVSLATAGPVLLGGEGRGRGESKQWVQRGPTPCVSAPYLPCSKRTISFHPILDR